MSQIDLSNIDLCGPKLQAKTTEMLLTESSKVVTADSSYDGMSSLVVTHAPVESNTNVSITTNGTYTLTPDSDYDATIQFTANVNVSGGSMDITGTKFGYNTTWTSLPSWVSGANWSILTDLSNMFENCTSLTTIPSLDTSSATDMSGMFNSCSALTSVPQLVTTNVTNMDSMFSGCETLITVPAIDTSSVTNMDSMFLGCSALTTISGIDLSSITAEPEYMFGWMGLSTLTSLTVTGSINFSSTTNLPLVPNLDYNSIKSILTAMSNTTDPSTAKTMTFNHTMTDQGGELAALVTDCESKAWTITGLTIN